MVMWPKTGKGNFDSRQERVLLRTYQPAHSEAYFNAVEVRAKVLALRL